MTHPDLPAEQAHVDLAYARLAAMRAAAARMLQDAFSERGGTFQAVTERDIRVRNSLSRLEQLEIGRESLVFGRIDRRTADVPANGSDVATEAFHIGRLAISDRDQEPLVVDWRAPVAEPFYRATGAHPMGLYRRRHFLTEGQRILDLEDELFDLEGSDTGVGLGLSGPQVLLATLERSRTGRMRDIVATVQREQDEIIRGPLPGILVVQGGPGTGKTAVALHRAAYLLYTYRFPLEGQGVLVVGPNPTFLRYIEHVLPSLDESGVELSTVNGLFSGARPVAREEDDIARLKGDARMARVLARAVADRERPLRRTVEVAFGPRVLRITPEISAQVVTTSKRRPGPHNLRRRTVEALLWRALLEQVGPGGDRTSDPEASGDPLSAEELGRTVRRQPEVVAVLERMWPLLTPQQLLHDLFGATPLIDLAAGKVLSPAERGLLWRPRSADVSQVRWTPGDVPLLDEARALLGPPRRRLAPEGEDQVRTYGHVVVDEAQDLTPMQLRMVARRSLSGSMTVVGDIAQSTGSWVPASWSQVVEHLPGRRGWRLAELTVNYRTPSEIVNVAGRILEQVAPGMRPPEAVRSTGRPPRTIQAAVPAGSMPGEALGELAAGLVRGELEGFAGRDGAGTVAVIVPPSLLDPVASALDDAGLRYGQVGGGALDEQVTLLAIEDAKGLEFDSVVVVEPARIIRETAQGLRALYVAFTRATQRLSIAHAESLPAPVAAAAQSSA
jgi:AAA domain/UvrD-like helicase C-terminal domain